jgi:hypothetical protein
MEREIVDAAQVGQVLAYLSGAALVAAALLVGLGRMRNQPSWFRAGLGCAVAILAWPLWMVYNRIEDQFGLDSVAGLLTNLALFLAVGVGGGLLLRKLWSSPDLAHRGDTETQRIGKPEGSPSS